MPGAVAPCQGLLPLGTAMHGSRGFVPGAAAAPGVLLAAASWVYVPEPPKNCRGGVPQSIPKLHLQIISGYPPPGLALCFPPLQGLCRGTSLTDPLPKTNTRPDQELEWPSHSV